MRLSFIIKTAKSDVYVVNSFRPIAPTYLRPALQAMLSKRFPAGGGPNKDVLSLVVDSANGDIRSAVMALQFASPTTAAKGKKRGGGADTRALMEVVTRREQSLALFHLLGKLFYNKRASLCTRSQGSKLMGVYREG